MVGGVLFGDEEMEIGMEGMKEFGAAVGGTE